MGLTDQNVHEAETSALSDAEAFAGIVLATVASDGQISESEKKRIHFTFSRMRLFRGWSEEQYHTMSDKLLNILKQQGLDTFLETSVRSLNSKFYQTVFAIAVDLVLADGIVNKEEKDFLYDLQQKLKIETELATKIIEVIIIKNHG